MPAGEGQRTSPLGFVVQALESVRKAILPVIAVLFGTRQIGDWGLELGIAIGLIIITLNAGVAWLGWTRRRYFVGPEDIRVESGIISREARSIPYERIQDVSLEQKLLPRLFGLTTIRFETGAGGKDELELSYVTYEEGESLRELVRERREAGPGQPFAYDSKSEAASGPGPEEADDPVLPQESGRLLFAMDPKRLLLFGLFEFSLVIFAVLLGMMQQVEFLLPFDLWDSENWVALRSLWRDNEQVAADAVVSLTVTLIIMAGVLSLGIVTGLARTFARDWAFRLERTSRGFRRRRGLFTRTDVVMPVHRVQAASIDTGILRRLFGWHGLTFISLAQDSGSASHVVAPFARMAEIWPIAREAGLEPPSADLAWHRPKADRWFALGVIAAIPVLAGAIFLAVERHWVWGVLLACLGLPLIALRQYYAWKRHRHALGPRQLFVREGWITPELVMVQRVKLQSVEIACGPLGRWLGYGTLHFGLAGGKLSIPGIPLGEAFAIRDSILTSIAGVDFSDLPR
ncbi:hypothetical protein D6851_09530 [Altericroceibacterium spongiae]|uniref:YdbS-like PH domain-containing protein n=1 Tax=Altericroceibacterium spongiae TaxID=2320269 RepID=A0A420EKZ7_9SPHN|nr:hypothetical protein D6851_09530 [Altericroceibacterium spongiae]